MDTQVGASEEGLEEITQKEPLKAIVVEDVRILKRVFRVDVPRYKDVEQIHYVTTEEGTIRYNVEEQSTTKYIPKEEATFKYVVKEEDTIKYIPKEEEYTIERPVLVDKRYERPVVIDKEYQIATYKDVDALKSLLELVPKVLEEIEDVKAHLDTLKEYKLVEELVRAPKIKWIPTEEERIVWTDVPRERCEKCSKEIV